MEKELYKYKCDIYNIQSKCNILQEANHKLEQEKNSEILFWNDMQFKKDDIVNEYMKSNNQPWMDDSVEYQLVTTYIDFLINKHNKLLKISLN